MASARMPGSDRAQDRRERRRRVGRGHQERSAGRGGEFGDLPAEGFLDAAGHRQCSDHAGRVGNVVVVGLAPVRSELDGRQGVAFGLLEHAGPQGVGQSWRVAVEHAGGVGVGEAGKLHGRYARGFERHRRLAHGEEHRDRVGLEAAGGEQQRLRGALVEPLQVVDDAQERGVLGEVRQQRQGAGGDQEPVGLGAVGQPEGAAQRGGLRPRQGLQPVQVREQHLVQSPVGQFGVGFDPGRAEDVETCGLGRRGRVAEQHRFADPGLAPNHERGAALLARVRQESFDPRQLAVSSHQRHALTIAGSASPRRTPDGPGRPPPIVFQPIG